MIGRVRVNQGRSIYFEFSMMRCGRIFRASFGLPTFTDKLPPDVVASFGIMHFILLSIFILRNFKLGFKFVVDDILIFVVGFSD